MKRSSLAPACNDVAPVRRMLLPLRSDLAPVRILSAPLSMLVVLLRSVYGAAAQVGWRPSVNTWGAAAQVRAVLYRAIKHCCTDFQIAFHCGARTMYSFAFISDSQSHYLGIDDSCFA